MGVMLTPVGPLLVTAVSRWQLSLAANSDIPCTALYKGWNQQPRAKFAPACYSATRTLSMSVAEGTNERTIKVGAQCVDTDSDCGVLQLTLTCSLRSGQPTVHCLWLTTDLRVYLLTPYNTDLLEKLTGLQLVKKFPASYVTRRFITVFTSSGHLSLS
jgi:hypothetical protein